MTKAKAFFLIVLLWFSGFFTVPLHAQEEDYPDSDEDEVPIESDWGEYITSLYSLGDKIFNISLGVVFPTVFVHQGKSVDSNLFPVGGTGSLSYCYFLNSNFFVGGEIGGIFNYTIANNTLFIIPIGFRLGYQFLIWKLEIPLFATIGIAPQRFLNQGYFGFFMKGGAGIYYRFSPDWSFGLNANWGWFPQWTKEREKNVHGNLVDLTLSARYHF